MGRSSELDGLTTLPELLTHSIRKWGDREALRQFDRSSSTWGSWSYKELGEHVLEWRRAYEVMGLRPGDRIAILMPNGRDHVCADQAALANGLIPVPLHAIDTPGASAFIMIDSQACTLVTNKLSRWKQIRATGVQMPDLSTVLITDPGETEDHEDGRFHIKSLASVLELGESVPADSLPSGPLEDDLAGIVYTSGTTGRPKGVMLTHRNIVSNVKATLECVSPREGDIFLSFLPLSHTFERTAGYYLALATGCTIAYNRSVLLLAEDLKVIRPTVIISVPRVYERIYARVQDKLRKSKPIARKLFDWAVEVGWRDFCRRNRLPIEESSRSWLDGIIRLTLVRRMADMLLSQFGGRLRIAISGGAALNHKVARAFCGLGLPIIQGYGMTETSPIIAVNRIGSNHPTTVGPKLDNIEVRLSPEGELQVRGPSVMQGYWHREDATKAILSDEGWLSTGDVAEIYEDGHIRITGRIKEIIVTSSGEKVPPADLEAAIECDRLFSQTMAVGDDRPCIGLVAVVNPDEWKRLAESLGLDPEDEKSLASREATQAALRRIKAASAGFPNYGVPRVVTLLRDPWTIENGLLTPTLKIKRAQIVRRYGDRIDAMYEAIAPKKKA
mgnify:FL=1